MAKKIFITGSSGAIGTVIQEQLPEYSYVCFDLPENNAQDYERLITAMKGSDVVIHLAWNTKTANWLSGTVDPNDLLMTSNVYRAAEEAGVRRVIMASSIHANDLIEWKGPQLLSPTEAPSPDSPYGAGKVFMESLGRYYAKRGLEVVCVRFMGLNRENRPFPTSEQDPLAQEKWFSHRDCGNLIRSVISAEKVPESFVIMYGVSNNKGKPVDTINPFGWTPQDDSHLL